MLDIIHEYWLSLLVGQYLNRPLGGLAMTLIVAVISILLALPLALGLALSRLSAFRWLRLTSTSVVNIVRGIPLLMLIFRCYFVIPIATGYAASGTRRLKRSSILCRTTKSDGTKTTVRQVEPIMPVRTAIPIDFCALAPAPVCSTSGTTPRMKAIDVIRIGRSRVIAALMAASTVSAPSCSRRCRAVSTIRIAFLADSATSNTRPICV
jgi:His/Glu/Gln/Arg/opine family amino acid ABC transporter permease subunit